MLPIKTPAARSTSVLLCALLYLLCNQGGFASEACLRPLWTTVVSAPATSYNFRAAAASSAGVIVAASRTADRRVPVLIEIDGSGTIRSQDDLLTLGEQRVQEVLGIGFGESGALAVTAALSDGRIVLSQRRRESSPISTDLSRFLPYLLDVTENGWALAGFENEEPFLAAYSAQGVLVWRLTVPSSRVAIWRDLVRTSDGGALAYGTAGGADWLGVVDEKGEVLVEESGRLGELHLDGDGGAGVVAAQSSGSSLKLATKRQLGIEALTPTWIVQSSETIAESGFGRDIQSAGGGRLVATEVCGRNLCVSLIGSDGVVKETQVIAEETRPREVWSDAIDERVYVVRQGAKLRGTDGETKNRGTVIIYALTLCPAE